MPFDPVSFAIGAKAASGGGGGGGNLVVHVAVNNGTYTADKTAAEIYPYAVTGNVFWLTAIAGVPATVTGYYAMPCIGFAYMSGDVPVYQFSVGEYQAFDGSYTMIDLTAEGDDAYPSYVMPG